MSQSLSSKRANKSTQNSLLNGRDLFYAWLILFFFLFVCIPKIYLINQIYYESRKLTRIENYLMLLQEENQQIKRDLEIFRFTHLLNSES